MYSECLVITVSQVTGNGKSDRKKMENFPFLMDILITHNKLISRHTAMTGHSYF